MKREIAERLTAAMQAVETEIWKLANVISEVDDKSERDLMHKAWGEADYALHTAISVVVARHFPDLQPEVRLSSAGRESTSR